MEFRRQEPKLPKTRDEVDRSKRLIVVIEGAPLETGKIGQDYKLLNSDDHKSFIKKHKKVDPALYRPDILHQTLLSLFDSPLNKAGLLQVYVRTSKNVLIEINPKTRIPRTFKRFCGLFVQLLHKLKIRATNAPETLLQVIRNPIVSHLPVDCRRIGTSSTGRPVGIQDFVNSLEPERPVVFVVGGFSHGHLDVDFVEEYISVSEYPLSAAVVCSRLAGAFEELWGVK
jgi:rRNA small subunit pseudouridine methyltransferase Nep1